MEDPDNGVLSTMQMRGDEDHDTFLSHFLAALFVFGFGVSFTALLCTRLEKIQRTCRDSNVEVSYATIARLFLERHVPEQNPVVLVRSAYALLASTLFGLLYGGLRGWHDFKQGLQTAYPAHLTLLAFYLFVGWTTMLESMQRLPPDSSRVAVVMALLGEVLSWHKHAAHKPGAVAQDLHEYMALSSGITAICVGCSVILGSGTMPSASKGSQSPNITIPFLTYSGGFFGFIHQGLWFFVIALHLKFPIARDVSVTTYFCLMTIVVALLAQGIVATLCSSGSGTAASALSSSLNTNKDDDSELLLPGKSCHEGLDNGLSSPQACSHSGQHP